MTRLKKTFLGFALAAAVAGLGVALWLVLPVTVDVSKSDPAVEQLNKSAVGQPQYQEGYIERNGTKLHYVTAGEGPPILFLHGFPSYWLSFVRQLEALKADYQVIAVDGLGVGRSDSPSDIEQYQLEPMSQHLMALLDSLNIEKVHLVGHDWGAVFAMSLAQRYPDRVQSVAGIAGPPLNVLLQLISTDGEQQQTLSYIERLKAVNPALAKIFGGQRAWKGAYVPLFEKGLISEEELQMFRLGVANGKRINAHLNWYRANIPSPLDINEVSYWPSKGAGKSAPALFIWGEHDQLIGEESVQELERSISGIKLLKINEAGHWPHVEKSQEVTDALRQHILSSHTAASP